MKNIQAAKSFCFLFATMAKYTTFKSVRKLTVNCMETMVGKEMAIYLCEYTDVWPTKATIEKKPSLRFIPNGDARVRKTIYANWLHTRTPSIRP